MAERHRACQSCGTANERDARFCEGCGGELGRACKACGVEANATARFCRACGAQLGGQVSTSADATPEGPSRKTVTVMFADLAGSTTFEEQVDAETARNVMSRYHDVLRMTAERNRAGVTKYIGDGFMAVWGVPEMGPDDADHAVAAAVELQEHFVDFALSAAQSHGVELALRVAVNTGEVVVGAGDADLVGDALNVAARLESECPRGHVVVGEETWRSTRGRHRYESLGYVQVKGRTAPVAVYQWLGRESETADSAPFVGRTDETRRLNAALEGAVAAQAARLVTVIGDPGVGKSRLAAEFVAAQRDGRVIRARCDVEGTVALSPIVEVLRARDLDADVPAGIPERDRILRDLKGLAAGVPGSVEETFWALRRFVEFLATDGPLVIVVDDIQWADTLLLDFVEHLAEWVREVPVLVVALARPELRELRADLVTVSRWVSDAVHLSGLDPRATAELAAGVLGAGPPEELLRRLPSSTGGNPLFVRELVGMLVHDGVLVAEPSGWRLTIDVDAIAIPPTIQALLASRLERLNAADRRVLEIASVVGSDFSLGATCALAGRAAADVKGSLDRLRRLELAQPSGAYLGDEPVWRFNHVLIRDVAYRRLLKSDRADLHERLSGWVEAGGASVAFDADEMMARHLEAAHGYRLELGMQDEHTGELALRSARCYLASARRALDRDELISAGTQAARGAALAAADNAVHAELLLVGCEAFLSAGDVTAGAPLVDDLDRIASDALAPWATCYRCQYVVYTDPERLLEVDARLQSAIDEFGHRRDSAGLAKAHRVRASTRSRLGRIGDAEVDLFEALIAARRGGDHRQITAALGAAPSAALWGPSPVPKAGGRCLDVVRMQRMTTAAPSLEATSLRCLAVLELLRGRPDKARSMLADARQIVADLGLRHGLMETELFAGIIESMEGDPVAAEPHFRTALEGLDALGVGADAGQAAALLARSVLAQGRVHEADLHAAESERLAGHNLKTAIAWRAVRAEILAAQGNDDEAVAKAREAVAVAAGTDLVLDHAEACLALGRVLAAAGDASGAASARDDAATLYAAKETASSIGRAVEPVVPDARSPTPRTPRLATTNRASELTGARVRAMQARDLDAVVEGYSDRFVYDDRRRVTGDPIEDIVALRAAMARIVDDFPRVEWHTLAVRGESLHLAWTRWSNDAGYETTNLRLSEIGDDGRITYHGLFDADDFEAAYRQLEHRYYTGEGVAFDSNGHLLAEWIAAMNCLDVEAARRLAQPEFRWLTVPSALASIDHSVDDLFRWLQGRASQVSSVRHCVSAIRWPSRSCCVAIGDARAVGLDGEDYEWTRLYVAEFSDGLLASVRQFELDDEDAAFVYAETLATPQPSRLAVANRATQTWDAVVRAMRAGDARTAIGFYSDPITFDDRRRLSGDPVHSNAEMQLAAERVLAQYTHFDGRTLAVRGERSLLYYNHWADDDGNETNQLQLIEVDDDGRITYEGRFDGDDFDTAYRELERRYYAGEGAAMAPNGHVSTEWMTAMDHVDVEAASRLTQPEFRWLALPTALTSTERSVDELFHWLQERLRQVSSLQNWVSAIRWLSPSCAVGRGDTRAAGLDGEDYDWARIYVVDYRDGLLASVHQFELDDEQAAFAYAEKIVTPRRSRLAVANRASDVVDALTDAMRDRDVDGANGWYSDRFVFEDRRPLSGDPIAERIELHQASERILAQYTRFERRTLAVRGDRLELGMSHWSNDAGYETTYLFVNEIDQSGRIDYEGCFDGDDFEGAYRELERRYYTGEGAPYAESGAGLVEIVVAHNRGDLATVFGELISPELRIENRSRSAFPDRSAAELRASTDELQAMFASVRICYSAVCWLSRTWVVARQDREAVGPGSENYQWVQLYVTEFRDGLATSICAFDVDDEDEAFAYAEERMRAAARRLALTNRAGETVRAFMNAGRAKDIDAMVGWYSDPFTFDDRRRLGGDPIAGDAALRLAQERILEQYSHFDMRTLAVRGARLHLGLGRMSNDAGYETTHLYVHQINGGGRIEYEGRFDEDDFESAYRELEARSYAGQGAENARTGNLATELLTALDSGNFDRMSGELMAADFVVQNQSRGLFGDRSAAQLRATEEELHTMVVSARTWYSTIGWLSPTCFVARIEREAVGQDDERYAWSGLIAAELRDERFAWACQFDADDEDAAIAYAEERIRATASRLALTNQAGEVMYRAVESSQARDFDAAAAVYSDEFVFDDRRRLSGDPIEGRAAVRAALERFHDQYPHLEGRALAVRGERLLLASSRWSDDAGNETAYLHVCEIGDDRRITYDGRFDEDDFEGAYRELERRYYAGEGAAFAAAGEIQTNMVISLNRGDLDRVFGDFYFPGMLFEVRSRSAFPDRSGAELRASLEEFDAWVEWWRAWPSAIRWLSPTCCVMRNEREAVGRDGEQYAWTQLYVTEFRDGRSIASCEFDVDDEDRAFAYAEERVRASASRVAVTNQSCAVANAMTTAHNEHDTDGILRCFSDRLIYEDRRRLSGDPVRGVAEFRWAFDRVLKQYSNFRSHILAVRGDRLHLNWTHWSDDAGNESAYLHVFQTDDDGRIVYNGRFDEDDFDGAYRELEQRYYSGEGAAFAECGLAASEASIAINQGDFDRLFGELCTPDMRVENRSRTAFPDRSITDLRASFAELDTMVTSARTWMSVVCWLSPAVSITRLEREAAGQDGERYAWTRLIAAEHREGRFASMCEFELEDEEAAFAYAAECVRDTSSRLDTTDRAKDEPHDL